MQNFYPDPSPTAPHADRSTIANKTKDGVGHMARCALCLAWQACLWGFQPPSRAGGLKALGLDRHV